MTLLFLLLSVGSQNDVDRNETTTAKHQSFGSTKASRTRDLPHDVRILPGDSLILFRHRTTGIATMHTRVSGKDTDGLVAPRRKLTSATKSDAPQLPGHGDATFEGAAKPDDMFHSAPSALSEVTAAWWGHFKYISVFAVLVTLVLYSIIRSIKEKCAQGLTRELFETHGQSEVRFFFFFKAPKGCRRLDRTTPRAPFERNSRLSASARHARKAMCAIHGSVARHWHRVAPVFPCPLVVHD